MASEETKAKAQAEKALGTTAYKAKDFETALKHYNEAAAIDATDMVYHLNIGAVYLEMGEPDKVKEVCLKAAEVGSENRADFKMIAKAFGRIAKAYNKAKDYETAVTYYDKALTNHRFKEYLNGKQAAQKAIKEAIRLEYINPELAAEAKARGNAHFKASVYPDAIKEYTEALDRNPDDDAFCSRVFSNRSACYTKLVEIPHALKDAESCIKADPAFIKGYLRKGNALIAMKRESEAEVAFTDALKLDPNNAEAKQGYQSARGQKFAEQANMTDQERVQNAMKDPEVQQIMSDPVMKQILQQMQENPQSAQDHMKNPEVSRKIMKLADAGILRMA